MTYLVIGFIKLFDKKQDKKVGQSPNSGTSPFFYKNILFIRIDRIGDILLITPAVRAIKKNLDANIYVLATEYNKNIFLNNRNITEILIYDKNPFKHFKLIKKLQKYNFDVAIDFFFDFNLKSAMLTYFSRAKIRLGYYSNNGKYFFNNMVKIETPSTRPSAKYEALKHLELIKTISTRLSAGVYDNDISLELNCKEEDFKKTDNYLLNIASANKEKKFFGINPGARRKSHLWQPEKFAKLADLFIQKYKILIIITWGPGELKLAEKIKNKMKETAYISYETDILELSSLISKFQLFVCSDTGPFHVAVSQKTPIVALFGKGDYIRWSPPGEKNIKIIKDKKVKDISVEEVFAEVENLIG